MPLNRKTTQALRRNVNKVKSDPSCRCFPNLLLTSFSVLALLLAAVGIYGTMSLYVGSRKNEFGIRLALGAQPGVLLRLVLREGMLLIAPGIAIGVGGASF